MTTPSDAGRPGEREVCINCGGDIHHPARGSYPASVSWVHYRSPVGPENRYCSLGSGATAQPRGTTPTASTDQNAFTDGGPVLDGGA